MALSKVGGNCMNFSEIDNDAIATYCANFNESPKHNLGDITQIKSLPTHNLLTAGVPCQSWSIAGKNLGFDDDRGQLWNDTIFLLNQSKPDAFIFENVKGLVDPRNKEALNYILSRIQQAGYFANYFVLNSFDYGVPQNRVRIYIVGFREKIHFKRFKMPKPVEIKKRLCDILPEVSAPPMASKQKAQTDLFGETVPERSMSLSNSNGYNDYFLFNDLRNGHSTVHSWDIIETTERQKHICYLLLKNRRKSVYGKLDGNPLALVHFQKLDSTIRQEEIDELVEAGILQAEEYAYRIGGNSDVSLTEEEALVLSKKIGNTLISDELKSDRSFKLARISITKTLATLNVRHKSPHSAYAMGYYDGVRDSYNEKL